MKSSRYSNKNLRRKGKKSHKGKMLKLWLFIAVIVGIAIFLYRSSILNVDDFQISGVNENQLSGVYDTLTSNFQDKKIYEVEKGLLTRVINDQFPQLKLDQVEYKFPNDFNLQISERTGKYKFQAENGVFVADEEGFVIEQAQESSPSVDLNLMYDKSVEVGQKVEDAAFQAGMTYSELNQMVKIEGDQVKLELENGGQVILPANEAVGKANEFYSLLQKIIQKYNIDSRQIDSIDLRFSKPVIKYKE